MNANQPDVGLSAEELDAQGATALPDKEVVSILDLNADINLAIDAGRADRPRRRRQRQRGRPDRRGRRRERAVGRTPPPRPSATRA